MNIRLAHTGEDGEQHDDSVTELQQAALQTKTIDTTVPGPAEVADKPNYVLFASIAVLALAVIAVVVIAVLKKKAAAKQSAPKDPEPVTVKPTGEPPVNQ